MGKVAMGWSDWGDAASLETIGNEPGSGAVAANLQTMQPTELWESTDLTNLHFELDRGSAEALNVVALLYTNASSGATWRIRAADDQASLTDGSADYDSGSITLRAAGADDTWERPHGVLWISAGITRRWLRIDITDGSNPDGVFRAGRLVIGDLWQPARNAQYPIAFGPVDDTQHKRTDGGSLIPIHRGDPYQVADLRFKFLNEAESLEHVHDFRRRRGRRYDMLVLLDPEDASYLQHRTLYGLITRDDALGHAGFQRFEHRVQINELT
jgi:hypothetical protein